MSFFHTDLCKRARARNLADQLATRDTTDRRDLMTTMVIENGGSLIVPRKHDSASTQRFELSVLGQFASGDTLDETIVDWIIAARRCEAAQVTSDAHLMAVAQ